MRRPNARARATLEAILFHRSQPPTRMEEAQAGQIGQMGRQSIQIRAGQGQPFDCRKAGQVRGAEVSVDLLGRPGQLLQPPGFGQHDRRPLALRTRAMKWPSPGARCGHRRTVRARFGHDVPGTSEVPGTCFMIQSGLPGEKPGHRGASTRSNSGWASRKRAIVPSFSSGLKVRVAYTSRSPARDQPRGLLQDSRLTQRAAAHQLGRLFDACRLALAHHPLA